ncbi:hypothetical protein EC973_002249 [Apophysomyces ossiformis]|uniref:PCI domain-containing protein n=1 Tax=Apophysomyces ossiformis TaxID=679940 RepID=A0A8H7BWD8_9FUNG|nr:hypothetical protein EC973_002249 [Apophysomyces ossiformis]
MSVIENFCSHVKVAYVSQNPSMFASLFQLDVYNPGVVSLRQVLAQLSDAQCEQIVDSILEDESTALAAFVMAYLELLRHLADSSRTVMYEYFEKFYSCLVPVFNSPDTYYQVPLVKTLSNKLVALGFEIDRQERLRGKASKAHAAARLLSKMFNIMLADRSPMEISKRQGIFYVTNLAFKVYFKLDATRLCQTYITNIRTGGVDVSFFPMADQVTYRYYLGRYLLYQNRLKTAEEHLLYSFEKCPAQHWHNKRCILKYLIPCRILRGHFPNATLLNKYQLSGPFSELIRQMKLGNLHGYLAHIDKYFQFFYQSYTYVMLRERGTVLLWRSLLRRIWLLTCSSGASHILLYTDCLKALQYSAKDLTLDLDDMESILVSLITQKYIRAYLHHQKQQVVLSKKNPFPAVSDVPLYTERYDEEAMSRHQANSPRPVSAFQ